MKLREDGMDSWIKLFCFILITGCSSVDFILFPEDKTVQINDEIINSPYAMQIVRFDNDKEDIYLLNRVNKNTQTWFKGSELFMNINHGKITKTIGFDNNFEIISYKGHKSLKDTSAFIRFKNPESDYMEIFFSYKLLKYGNMKKLINGTDFDYRLIEESFTVPLIKWSGKNYYWIDSEDDIWMSKQEIDPFGKKVRITVLKKYSD
jgi:hypothetical protein